jgi:hypothetical protein
MANGKWVNVPGKGRRFLTSEGEYRYGDPNAPLAPAASAVKSFFGGILNAQPRFSPEQMRGLTAPGLSSSAGAAAGPSKGQQRPDGKFYTGSRYGWQSGSSAARAGLLGSEVVGDAAFGGARSPMGPPIPGRIANAPSPLALPLPTSGSSFATDGSPADRAYQQEASRVAQLTAQDPELQRYEKARSAAKTQEEMNAARDIGMQIWQQKYGGTPMGQPGGAVGSFNPLMQKTFGYQAGMSPNQIAQTITNPADIPVAPGEAPYQTGDFGTRVGVTGYDPVKYGITPEMIEQLKAQSLAQARK